MKHKNSRKRSIRRNGLRLNGKRISISRSDYRRNFFSGKTIVPVSLIGQIIPVKKTLSDKTKANGSEGKIKQTALRLVPKPVVATSDSEKFNCKKTVDPSGYALINNEDGSRRVDGGSGGRWWNNPRISGIAAAILLVAMLVTAALSSARSVEAGDESSDEALNVYATDPEAQTATLKLAKEYVYAGSRMLAIEDYGLGSSTPTPTPTATPTATPTVTPTATPTATPTPAGRMNVALASNGATVTASSTYGAGYPASAVIDGFRHPNNQYGSGGSWVSAVNPATQPQWVEVQFPAAKTVNEVDVFTLADAIQYATNPSLTDTFTQYGVINFSAEYWNGSSWTNLATVTNNNKVWNQLTFSPVTTSKIRVLVTQAGPGAGVAHLVEVEAWSAPSTTRANVALASNGASVSATSTYGAGYPASALIDGFRHPNNQYGSGGSWVSAVNPATQPQSAEIQFPAAKAVDEVDVFTIADAVQYATNPTLADTFTQYGVIAYTVDYWNGSSWVTLATVTNNNKVWRQFTFTSVTTTKIRVLVTQAGPGAGVAHLVEVEAWGNN